MTMKHAVLGDPYVDNPKKGSGGIQSVLMVLLAVVAGGFVGLIVGPPMASALETQTGLYFWTTPGCALLAGLACLFLERREGHRR